MVDEGAGPVLSGGSFEGDNTGSLEGVVPGEGKSMGVKIQQKMLNFMGQNLESLWIQKVDMS